MTEEFRLPSRIQMPTLVVLLICAVAAVGQDTQNQGMQNDFRTAAANFDAGNFAKAASELEALLQQAPKSFDIFDVQELLGLAYASQSQDAKALPHLESAVRLKPDSPEARTNLAASLDHAGKFDQAGEQFRKALALEPHNYSANHNLAEFYIRAGKITDARPLLEEAQRVAPSSYNNGYDLALAEFLTGHLNDARQSIQTLLPAHNTGELHNLLGQIDEKDSQYVAAENEFQTAAQLDPSEDNLFAWGTELLLHRAYAPATEVFKLSSQRYPDSQRIKIGLGMAFDLGGHYDEAINALLAAADLNPSDSHTYLFLSKAYGSSPRQADEVIQRFQRYASLKSNDAEAQYLYAMSVWKGKRLDEASQDIQTIESLLQKAIALDASLADAHFQLGNLYADQHQYEKALPEHRRAVQLNATSSDAHYRLGQDMVHTGEKEQAQREFDTYQHLRAEHLAQFDKEKAELQQFVLSEQASASPAFNSSTPVTGTVNPTRH